MLRVDLGHQHNNWHPILWELFNVFKDKFDSVCGLLRVSSLCIMLIAVLQYLVLYWGSRVTPRIAMIMFFFAVVFSFCFSSMFIACRWKEVRGSHCSVVDNCGWIVLAIWLFFTLVLPLTVTIVFSSLTCFKVKESVLHHNVVRSVVLLNIITVAVFIVIRVSALLISFISFATVTDEKLLPMWAVVADYVCELNYPFTLVSIVFVHKGLWKQFTACMRRSHQVLSAGTGHVGITTSN